MELKIPAEILEWLDSCRGDKSRQAYIIRCIAKIKEVHELTTKSNK